MTSCTRCGQSLEHPVFINGVAYGSDCARKVMGLKELPFWFNEKSGEDFFVQKQKHEDLQKANLERHEKSVEITRAAWNELYTLSKVYVNFIEQMNDWGMGFVSSIARQLGFHSLLLPESLFSTYDEAISNWKEYMGSFPYLNREPKRISDLSEKQQAVLNRYL